VALVGAASGAGGGPNRIVRFSELPRGSLKGIPRDVRPHSRIVGKLDGYTIAAGPTRNGNYCEAFTAPGKDGGWGGCRVRGAYPSRVRGDYRSYLIGASVNGNDKAVFAVSGSTAAGPRPHLYLGYADGSREQLPLIWVGNPIRAGFFYRTIPTTHRSKARRATFLELRDGTRLVARQQLLLPGHP
jgi:hypothetical protein